MTTRMRTMRRIKMAAQTIREVMTRDPRTVDLSASVADAALLMREADVGSVIVTDGNQVTGIVTDRDIAVRAVAMGLEPKSTPVSKISSSDPDTLSPDDHVGEVLRLMRRREVRRVPVVENGKPVGIVALGDLAVDRDPGSVLGDISAAPPNR
jgi:signal-transduction protein with cAMP-binding, CBS, and nucleotidyltransferase domain